jgi:hypothetical protein
MSRYDARRYRTHGTIRYGNCGRFWITSPLDVITPTIPSDWLSFTDDASPTICNERLSEVNVTAMLTFLVDLYTAGSESIDANGFKTVAGMRI